MSPKTEILLILGMSLVTFSTRYPVLVYLSRKELPKAFKQALGYVPPVVLVAIIVPEVLAPGGQVQFSLSNSALAASLISIFISWRTKNLLLTILVGMAVYWLWSGLG